MAYQSTKIVFGEKDSLIIEIGAFKITPLGIHHKDAFYEWKEGFELKNFSCQIELKNEEIYLDSKHWSNFIPERGPKEYSITMRQAKKEDICDIFIAFILFLSSFLMIHLMAVMLFAFFRTLQF